MKINRRIGNIRNYDDNPSIPSIKLKALIKPTIANVVNIIEKNINL